MALSKEKKKSLTAVMNKINKQFGANTVKIAGEHTEEMSIKMYPTTSPEVNEMLYGGFAQGKIIELYGPNSSGKTSLAMETVAYNMKIDPEFTAGFFETEESYDPEYARMLGIDLDRFVYWDQREYGAEKGLDILIALVASGEFNMIIVNSVAGLAPQREIDGNIEDSNMALVARMMSKLFRVVTGSAAKNKCSLVFINQIRSTMDQYKPEATSGGQAISFYSSQRVRMSKVKVQASDPITEEEGVKINCSTIKNRCAKGGNPYKKCTYYAIYGKGIDRMISLPDILEREGIMRKSGAWYYWEDESGQPMTVAGVLCKFQGKNALLETIRTNEGFYDAVATAIQEKALKGQTKGISMDQEEIALAKKEEEQGKELLEKE